MLNQELIANQGNDALTKKVYGRSISVETASRQRSSEPPILTGNVGTRHAPWLETCEAPTLNCSRPWPSWSKQ
jgi:hypothetical protein